MSGRVLSDRYREKYDVSKDVTPVSGRGER